jgi:FixJ family two-component response regulator
LAVTRHHIHVAVLDDDPSIRRALSRLLAAEELAVDTYGTAGLFLDSLVLKIPDCLLLDFEMPSMNGLDVLKYLNQLRVRISTIVITGEDETASREACLKAGAVAYLRKPLDAEQLIDAIVNVSVSPPSHI